LQAKNKISVCTEREVKISWRAKRKQRRKARKKRRRKNKQYFAAKVKKKEVRK
jgi:hypothetical protein